MARTDFSVGVVGYNGFRFPPPMRSTVNMTAVPSSDNRTIKYYQYRLGVQGLIVSKDDPVNSDDAAVDPNLDELREKLMQPGRELIFTEQGFGNTVINRGQTGGNTSLFNLIPQALQGPATKLLDVAYGPHPEVISWQPVGSNRAVNINWFCTFNAPFCETVERDRQAFSDFSYSVSWSVDESGMSTRVINGQIEIPATRNKDNRTIPDTADRLWDKVNFVKLINFERRTQRSLSPDKRTLTFNIVDSEIPSDNPFFNGTVRISATHSASSNLLEKGFREWDNRLSINVEIVPGFPKSLAWIVARHIIQERLKHAGRGQFSKGAGEGTQSVVTAAFAIGGGTIGFLVGGPAGAAVTFVGAAGLGKKVGGNIEKGTNEVVPSEKRKSSIMFGAPVDFSVTEEIYARRVSFSVGYIILSDLKSIFAASGMFQPITGTSFQQWQLGLTEATGNRGWANLFHKKENDLILDLCNQPSEPKIAINMVQPRQTAQFAQEVLGFDLRIDPDTSWIDHQNRIMIREVSNAVQHYPIHPTESESKKAGKQLDSPRRQEQDPRQALYESYGQIPKKNRPVNQSRGPGVIIVTIFGRAARVGFPISAPELKTSGEPPKLRRQVIIPGVIGSPTFPIHTLMWEREYWVEL